MNEFSAMELLSYLITPLVIAALAVLWSKLRSPWLLAALALEALSLLFRIGLHFHAEFASTQIYIGAWQLTGLLFAVCLLGFAVTLRR